jgi:hypothetical protein
VTLRRASLPAALAVGAVCACSSSDPAPAPKPSVTVGIDARPANATCTAKAPAKLLSQTGCVDAVDPKKPAPGVIPYAVNVPQWLDNTGSDRGIALPDGAVIAVDEVTGRLTPPVGTVLLKTVGATRRVETQVLARDAGGWKAWSYRWRPDESDAELVESPSTTTLPGGLEYRFMSSAECTQCHASGAGTALGWKGPQLNGVFAYANGRSAGQLETFEHIGILDRPVPAAASTPMPGLGATASAERRARAYLDANCAHCHSGGLDLRFQTPFAQTGTCNVQGRSAVPGVQGETILAPAEPGRSLLSVRLRSSAQLRMPPLGTRVADLEAASVVDAWIKSIPSCP